MSKVELRSTLGALGIGACSVLSACALDANTEEPLELQQAEGELLLRPGAISAIDLRLPPILVAYPWLPTTTTSVSCTWVGQSLPGQFSLNPTWLQPSLHLYGTDLGYSFAHKGNTYVLFGDSWPLPAGNSDDAVAIMGSPSWSCPPLTFESSGDNLSPIRLFAGAQVPLGFLRTPLSAVSSGPEAYAFFNDGAKTCSTNAECESGDQCIGPANATKYCWAIEGGQFAYPVSNPVRIAKARALPGTDFDHVGTLAARQFANLAARAVPNFDPASPSNNKYQVDFSKDLNTQGAKPAILVWGKPTFVSLAATAPATYLMYFDLTRTGHERFRPFYFTGMSGGVPQWSNVPPGSTSLPGIAPVVTSAQESIAGRAITYPAQMSMSYVSSLGYWVMLYGGRPVGVADGSPANDTGYGIYMRTAYHPWGPWSPPKNIWRATDSAYDNLMFHPTRNPGHFDYEFQYGAARNLTKDYGAEYGAAIVEPMTTSSGPGQATIHWALSTWNPYRVLLMQTDLQK